ncbi:ubiquinone biosynthesis protein COQ4 homolog, mitochondrial [Trichonephila clavipes]|nr:ubiquinone biosynthesis protein COQ4 homolog, mitochondrial [Trichonephila clavipes]
MLCITDPFRHDMIAVFGETTGYASAKQIREKMLNDPEGSTILKFDCSLPHGTLGQAYLAFLKDNNVTPDSRPGVTNVCICALFGPVRLRKKQREKYLKYYLPWAVNCGYEAKFLINVYFEKDGSRM